MINVLYIAVGEGGSDQALITLIKELKCKIRPYIILGKLASQSTIDKLKSGVVTVLVATDVAARGIDIDDVTHVMNFDLPYSADTYLHRIGRTARAGKKGTAVSFVEAHDYKLQIAW